MAIPMTEAERHAESVAPDKDCYTLPNGECVAPVCSLHGPLHAKLGCEHCAFLTGLCDRNPPCMPSRQWSGRRTHSDGTMRTPKCPKCGLPIPIKIKPKYRYRCECGEQFDGSEGA